MKIYLFSIIIVLFSCRNLTISDYSNTSLLQQNKTISIYVPELFSVKKKDTTILGFYSYTRWRYTNRNDSNYFFTVWLSQKKQLDYPALVPELSLDSMLSLEKKNYLRPEDRQFAYGSVVKINGTDFYHYHYIISDTNYVIDKLWGYMPDSTVMFITLQKFYPAFSDTANYNELRDSIFNSIRVHYIK